MKTYLLEQRGDCNSEGTDSGSNLNCALKGTKKDRVSRGQNC